MNLANERVKNYVTRFENSLMAKQCTIKATAVNVFSDSLLLVSV